MVLNKRQFMRFHVPLSAEFKQLAAESAFSPATILNFSRAGMCVVSDNRDLEVYDTVEFKLKLPQSGNIASAVGSVVWKSSRDRQCMTGIKLDVMDREAKFEILDHCYDQWLKQQGM